MEVARAAQAPRAAHFFDKILNRQNTFIRHWALDIRQSVSPATCKARRRRSAALDERFT